MSGLLREESCLPLTLSRVPTGPAVCLTLCHHLHWDLTGVLQEGLVLALLPGHHREVGDHLASYEASVDLPILGTVSGAEFYELKTTIFRERLI